MARHTRAPGLENRTGRLKLPVARKPLFTCKIGRGVRLGYRRNQSDGTWVVRVADGAGSYWTKRVADADDFAEANGADILTFFQAQDIARAIARGHGVRAADDGKLATVADALDRYAADLAARGGEPANVGRVRVHLPQSLASKAVALLGERELRAYRDALIGRGLTPASVNRTGTALKAALNLAAGQDERIANRRAWDRGLLSLPDAHVARNVILRESDVRAIVAASYWDDPAFGLLVEVLAVTGARPSQARRLEVRDLQDNRADPRLQMPSSKKGRGAKKVTHHPVAIPADLATRLRRAAGDRPDDAPLLLKATGEAWGRLDHSRPFQAAVGRAGLDATVTAYALRHTDIVRQLLAGIPARVVAVVHDTSIAMLERTYSRHIADVADGATRGALLDLGKSAPNNVVPIAGAR